MLGKHVRQIAGIPNLIGRQGFVVDSFKDEKEDVHCLILGDKFDNENSANEFWCPLDLLQIIEKE